MIELTDRLRREAERWRRLGERPAQIATPGTGQESVWEYPRPPSVTPDGREIRVEFAGVVLARTTGALRVCETAGAPVYYLPPGDVRTEHLEPGGPPTLCEWKGSARYFSVRVGSRVSPDAAWSYPEPFAEYATLRDFIAFNAGRVDAAWVGEERVTPQPGSYYGGWITSDVVGPFKGEPGSERW